MKKGARLTPRIISMILAILIVFYLLPISAVAEGISQSSTVASTNSALSEETENSGSNEAQTPYIYYKDAYEVEERREESVKHFRLEDGSYIAAQYSLPVHYLNDNGEWQDIDNSLSESGSELVTSDARVKFVKKTTGNGNLFTLHDGSAKITLSLVGANKKVAGVATNTEETETTKLGKLMNLEGLSSSIRYNDILDGVDIEYVLDSLSIKENIIIKEQSGSYSYTFTLSLNGLEAELLSNGDIAITKNGEQKYTIPAPVVFDSAEVTAPADAAEYTLTDNGNGKYNLTASVSAEWMNSPDRVYPVTLDPAIVTGSYVQDTYGTIGTASSNGSAATLTVSENQIALLKLVSIPTLPIGAHVAEAHLVLTRTSGIGSQIGAYIIENSWSVTSYDVANVVFGELLDHCSTRSNDNGDYGINGTGQFSFNVTKAVRAWYNGTANNGIALKPVYYDSPTVFASANNSVASKRPSFIITYVNTFGVEDYYSYSTQSGGAAGTGYVNYATGDLTFSVGTLTSTDYLMPVTPTLVYNSALANKSYTSANVNTPETDAYIADGFKLNFAETLLKESYYSSGALKYYYIWADADGTEHFFYPTETANIYRDDSGLLLTLDASTSTNPTITALNKTVRRFAAISGSSVAFRLSQITDKSGNSVTLVYNTYNQVTAINLKPKSGSTTTTLALYYNAGYLCRISSTTSGKSVILRYSDTYNGEISTTATKYLRQVIYAHGTDDSPSWSSYYTSGSASDVVTDAIMYYEYDENGYLLSAKNGLADYTVSYEWTDGKVSSVYEKGGTDTGIKIGFTYGEGYTEAMTPGGDARYTTTADNIINHYSYDSFFRVTNSYSMSYNRGTIYGASSGVYSDGGSEVGDGTKNKLTETVNISGASTNYILNGDFLDYSDTYSPLYWETSHSNITVGRASVDEAVTIPLSTSDTYYIYQYVYLPYGGEYTISFDVQSSNTKDIIMEVTPSSQDTRVNLDEADEAVRWYTVSKTFSMSGAGVRKVQISASRRSGATFTSTPYVHISKVRLEHGAGGGAYNYVDMGDFVDTYRTSETVDPTDVTIYTAWNEKSLAYRATTQTAPFKTSVIVQTYISTEKYIKQTFYTAPEDYIDFFATSNPMSNSARTYIVSGFAKGNDEVVANQKSKFALRADVYYYQGANKNDVVVSHYFNFNPDCTDWQFISGSLNTYRENELDSSGNPIFYDVVRKIDIVCEYSYQTNYSEVYFDRIAVTDAHNDRKLYEYENGQISKITGLFENEYREYDDQGRILRVADDSGNLVEYG